VVLGGWSAGPTWGDYDRDGLLDLFVPGYVKFDPDHPPVAGQGNIPAGFCKFRGIDVMCGPRGLQGEPEHLFHNYVDGTFTDVSVKAKVQIERLLGCCSFVDVDSLDQSAVANDSVPNYLYTTVTTGRSRTSLSLWFCLHRNRREPPWALRLEI
jgi:hypothetical protein